MKATTHVLLVLLFIGMVPAFGNWPSQIQAPEPLPTENDVLALCAADVLSFAPQDRYYLRYAWVVPSETMHEDMQAMSLVLNYVSRASVAYRPQPLGKGKLLVLRVDLRNFFPKEKDIAEAGQVWEELRFDPRFSLILTKDTLKFAVGIDLPDTKPKAKVVEKKKKREFQDQTQYKEKGTGKTLGYFDEKTKTYHPQPWVEETYTETIQTPGSNPFDAGEDVVRVVAPHLDPVLVATLVEATRSQAPVVSSGYLLTRFLTSIQDKGARKTLYRGLYQEVAGIRKNNTGKGTDEDLLFEQLGVGDVGKGVTAQQIFEDRTRADERVAMFESGVTGSPRGVEAIPTLATKPTMGPSWILLTHDLRRASIDVGVHPMLNLLDHVNKDDAREVIFTKANGLHGFALFNGKGALQEVVPADVAIDGTVPFPNHAELQYPIGCLRCHASQSGLRYLTNDVKTVTKGVDIFDDAGFKGKTQSDVIDRLAGLYAGDLEAAFLPSARDWYNRAILAATGPWKASKKAQTDIAKLTGDHIAAMFARYNYAKVGAVEALYDLGIEVKDAKEAQKALAKLLPPVPIDAGGFVREDVRIVALVTGLKLGRSDYNLIFSFLASRATKTKAGKK